MNQKIETARVRVDKWLWAARFFKTRQLAVEAIERGRVTIDELVVKASKELRGGELLAIRIGELTWEIEVLAVSDKRGPASVARLLYRETPEGAKARIEAIERKRLYAEPAQNVAGRPTKRDRRVLDDFKRG
ncbi:MAG: RNA-binding S4 domain-containing protein [Burkholderiaceae bacterium]